MPVASDEHFVHHQSMNVEDQPDATGNAKEIMRGRAEGRSSRPWPSPTILALWVWPMEKGKQPSV